MSKFKFQRLASAFAATALAAAFTGFAVAPAQAPTHSHDATAAPR
ncbi:MAG: hypothetical protein ABJA49_02280 [Betaproteobacteria bacterium]